jgi:dihydrofolate reductase
MIIGGAEIYRSTIGIADKVYLTRINRDFDGDAWFPELDEKQWVLDSVTPGDTAAEVPHEFLIYKKRCESKE